MKKIVLAAIALVAVLVIGVTATPSHATSHSRNTATVSKKGKKVTHKKVRIVQGKKVTRTFKVREANTRTAVTVTTQRLNRVLSQRTKAKGKKRWSKWRTVKTVPLNQYKVTRVSYHADSERVVAVRVNNVPVEHLTGRILTSSQVTVKVLARPEPTPVPEPELGEPFIEVGLITPVMWVADCAEAALIDNTYIDVSCGNV